MSERNVRVIIPTETGFVDVRRPANGVPWGNQAEAMAGAYTHRGKIGSIDYQLAPNDDDSITYLMEPGEGIDKSAKHDLARYGHDLFLLVAIGAARARPGRKV